MHTIAQLVTSKSTVIKRACYVAEYFTKVCSPVRTGRLETSENWPSGDKLRQDPRASSQEIDRENKKKGPINRKVFPTDPSFHQALSSKQMLTQ